MPSPTLVLALGLTSSLAAAGGELRLEGGQAGAQFGRALATGDVNGDGFGDLLVGAPGFDARVSDEGRVSLYLGSQAGLSSVPNWSATGTQPFEHFGASVSIADVNGDGKDDVLVSSPDLDRRPTSRTLLASLGHGQGNGLSSEGRVSVFLGTLGGLAATPQRVLTGIELGEHFGAALAGAGDVNGDGYEDVLVGATGKLQGLGGVFLFAGSSSGLRALPSWIRIGTSLGEGWGSVVGSAGDLDGDGFADFIASAPTRGSNGATELYLGSRFGPASVPDVTVPKGMRVLGPSANLDLFDKSETFYAAKPTTSPVEWLRFLGSGSGTFPDLTGTVRALALGDLNGDGLEEVVAGTPDFAAGPFRGRVWVYTNQPGTSLAPTTSFPVFDGDQAEAEWGVALATGDVDGDGADELFIGAPKQDVSELDEGLVEVVPGYKPKFRLATVGPRFTDFRSLTSGDFDGDGVDDLLASKGIDMAQQLEVRYGSPVGLPANRDGLLDRPLFLNFSFLSIWATAGDFNGDGFSDAAVFLEALMPAGHSGTWDRRFSLYLGSSAGLQGIPVFQTTRLLALEPSEVSDLNGDGRDDLIAWDSGSTAVFYGTSAGLDTVPNETFPFDFTHGGFRCGNLNGDGFADLIIMDQIISRVRAFRLLGSPSGLGPAVQANLPDDCALWLLADVNGDGYDDMGLRDGATYHTYLGSPGGFLTTNTQQWWNPVAKHQLRTAFDFDRDGFSDFLTSCSSLHLGSPGGVERSPSWWGPMSFVLVTKTSGDFDGDGQLELLHPEWPNETVMEFQRL